MLHWVCPLLAREVGRLQEKGAAAACMQAHSHLQVLSPVDCRGMLPVLRATVNAGTNGDGKIARYVALGRRLCDQQPQICCPRALLEPPLDKSLAAVNRRLPALHTEAFQDTQKLISGALTVSGSETLSREVLSRSSLVARLLESAY